MKKVTLILCLLLFISCSKNKDIKGFWHSQEHNILLNFNTDSTFVNYSKYGEIGYYTLTKKKLLWTENRDEYSVPIKFKVKITDNELFFYKYKTDSLLIKYQRSSHENYIFDYLSDKNLNIELPKGNGKLTKLGTRSYRFLNPIYLTFKDNKLISNFNSSTNLVDDNYYQFLRKNVRFNIYHEDIDRVPISLITDKNIKIKDIFFVEKQLKLAGFENLHYLNEINSYDEVNYFGIRMLPLPQEELDKYDLDFTEEDKYSWEKSSTNDDGIVVVTSEYVKEEKILFKFDYRDSIFLDVKPHAKLLEIDKSEMKFNNKIISLEELKNTVKINLTDTSDLAIVYYITDDSTYQNFISVLDAVYNTTEELRKEYLLEKYNMEYPLVRNNPQSNYIIEKDRIREVKRKYPFRFFRMNYKEYKEVKESL